MEKPAEQRIASPDQDISTRLRLTRVNAPVRIRGKTARSFASPDPTMTPPPPLRHDLPPLVVRGRSLLPVVQGGMGVGVSAHRL